MVKKAARNASRIIGMRQSVCSAMIWNTRFSPRRPSFWHKHHQVCPKSIPPKIRRYSPAHGCCSGGSDDLWTARHKLTTVLFSDKPVDPFFNANRPEDLETAVALLEAAAG